MFVARRKNKGFTIIEILLTLSIIAIFLAISSPLYTEFLKRNDLNLASEAVLDSLHRAEAISVASHEDDGWGIYVDNGGVILFKGSDFTGRDSSFDEVQDFAPNMSVSGLGEITFEKLTGTPSTSGTITLTNNAGNSRQVILNEEGSVYLQ